MKRGSARDGKIPRSKSAREIATRLVEKFIDPEEYWGHWERNMRNAIARAIRKAASEGSQRAKRVRDDGRGGRR